MEKIKIICGLVVIGMLLWVTPSIGQVSVNCPTDNLQTAITNNNPGTTFNVTGTCNENITISETRERVTIDGGGTATISGLDANLNTVTIRGQGVTVTGFTISGGWDGVQVWRGGTAIIDGNIIENAGRNGVTVAGNSYAIIVNNTITNSTNRGINVSENSGARIGFSSATDTVASPNTIQNSGSHGIEVDWSSAARIVGNTISSNDGNGVLVYRGSTAAISNNTINDNGDSGVYVCYDSLVSLGSLTGTGSTIFDLPNTTTVNNDGSGLGYHMGAMVTGRIGTLNGNSGPINSTNIAGIKTSALADDYGIDILTASSGLIRLGNGTTNNTTKIARMVVRHYNNAEEPVYLFGSASTSTDNFVAFGGGSPLGNAATQLDFFTAANNTTQTGTSRITIKSTGYVGIGTQSPAYPLQMAGGAYTNGSSWIDISSREYKENIEVLTTEEALEAIKELNPVKYAYKTDQTEKRVGFISEEVPELVSMKDRKGLSPMDIVAVLTKVVQEQQKAMQEQQKTISVLSEELKALKIEVGTKRTSTMAAPSIDR